MFSLSVLNTKYRVQGTKRNVGILLNLNQELVTY